MARTKKAAGLKIKLVKSVIGCKKDQIATAVALGLKKIGQSKIHNATPSILGMIDKVKHLVKVEKI